MDPFTQRVLERAKARREKLDSKLPQSEQTKRQRLPLVDSNFAADNEIVKSPIKEVSPKSSKIEKMFSVSSNPDDENDVAVKINIVHQNNVQVEVQVEEREVLLSEYLNEKENKVITPSAPILNIEKSNMDKNSKSGVRDACKSGLNKLSKFYSEGGRLSSPLHQSKIMKNELNTENITLVDKHPVDKENDQPKTKKFSRLAALADHINSWEDDTSHHDFKSKKAPDNPKPATNIVKPAASTKIVPISSSKTGQSNETGNAKPAISSKITALSSKLGEQSKIEKTIPSNRFVKNDISNNIFKKLDSTNTPIDSITGTSANKTPVKNFTTGINKTPTKSPVTGAPIVNNNSKTPTKNPVTPLNINKTPVKDTGNFTNKTPIKNTQISQDINRTPIKNQTVSSDKTVNSQIKDATTNKQTNFSTKDMEPISSSRGRFQPQVVGSSPKQNTQHNWDPKVLDNLERQGFSRAESAMAACAPLKRPAPPPPPPPSVHLNGHTEDDDTNRVPDEESTFETSFRRDPAHMSVREKKAMFERRPQASDEVKRFPNSHLIRPKVEINTNIAPVHAPIISRTGDKISTIITNNNKPTLGEREIIDKTKKEREDDMKVIYRRYQKPDYDKIEHDREDDGSSEISPLMGGEAAEKSNNTNLNMKKPAVAIPKVPQVNDEISSMNETTDAVISEPPKKRFSVDSPLVVSALEDVKKIKVAPPRPGGLYPRLSDVEGQTSEEERQSCPASLNTSSDSAANEHADNEEEWGNTSFGRDLLQAVGVSKTPERSKKITPKKTKTKSSDRKRVSHNSSSSSFDNENLDDLLDDAFDEEYGPTPPKQNKNGTQPSNSFCYRKGNQPDLKTQPDVFKSPLKVNPNKPPNKSEGTPKPLIHTVSFYRRSQMQASQPNTPVRVVRIEGEDINKEDKEEKAQEVQRNAQESRKRIKELLEESTKQNIVIAQASQALNLCTSTIEFSGSTEQAEGERLLLLATHRRQACLHEAQRIQVEGIGTQKGPRYTLNIEEISIPLRREYVRQINADGAVGHYLVCLVKCQERVMSTCLVKTTPDSFNLSFPDKFRLEGLDGEFKVSLEVYALQASKEFLPHEIKYHIATKKSGKLSTPKKGVRGADLRSPLPISSPGGPSAVRSPAMKPQGYCIFSYQQINRNNFTLSKAGGCSPVEGCIRVKLTCERNAVQTSSSRVHRGFLTMFEEAGGFGAWHRRWCVLHSGDLSYWKYPDDEKKKTPIGSVELSSAISETVGPAPRDLCARSNTLLLEVSSRSEDVEDQTARSLIIANGRRRYLLAADTRPERDEWAKILNETLTELRDAI